MFGQRGLAFTAQPGEPHDFGLAFSLKSLFDILELRQLFLATDQNLSGIFSERQHGAVLIVMGPVGAVACCPKVDGQRLCDSSDAGRSSGARVQGPLVYQNRDGFWGSEEKVASRSRMQWSSNRKDLAGAQGSVKRVQE